MRFITIGFQHGVFQDSPLFTVHKIVERSTAIGAAYGFTLD